MSVVRIASQAEAHRSPIARNRQALVGITKFTRRRISAYRALTSPAVSSTAGVLEIGVGVVVLEAIMFDNRPRYVLTLVFVTVALSLLGLTILGLPSALPRRTAKLKTDSNC